jgi:hypothetical protein
MTKYPTWRTINAKQTVSMEAVDGLPDWVIVYDRYTKRWCVSGRTSANWLSNDFPSLKAAKAHVEQATAR